MYTPRGRGGGSSSPMPFHCVLHANRGRLQKACTIVYIHNKRPLVEIKGRLDLRKSPILGDFNSSIDINLAWQYEYYERLTARGSTRDCMSRGISGIGIPT